MTVYNVRGDIKQITRDLTDVQRRQIPPVAARSINRVAGLVRKRGVRQIARATGIPQKYINNRFDRDGSRKGKRISIRRAKPRKWSAMVVFLTASIPAILLNARQTNTGVQTKVRFFKSGFIAKPKNNLSRQVFKRRTKKRYPIDAKKIPLLPVGTEIMDLETRRSGRFFVPIFEFELARKLARGNLR